MDGMLKLIYSSAFDPSAEVCMRIVEDMRTLTKSASTIFGMDYDALKPDDQHVGIHVTALGASERYGFNRNADGFPKLACVRFHDTFVKHGSLFRHHRNKDRSKALGSIKASAYNGPMDRIELFVHANKELARDELNRLEKEGEIPFSMACKVAYDRCSVPGCGRLRKNGKDPNQCDHVRWELGKLAEDGTYVGTYNDEPDFFDISFVGRPADRIAWNLKIAAGELVDSVKLAEYEGLWVPDYIAIESASGLAKMAHLRALADMQVKYRGWLTKTAEVKTSTDRYFYELRKAADTDLDDGTITKLREYEPRDVFAALAKVGAVLSPRSFFKYAMGIDYGEIAPLIPSVVRAVPAVIERLVKEGECQKVCNDHTFDVAPATRGIPTTLIQKLASVTLCGNGCSERVIAATLENGIPKFAVDNTHDMSLNTVETVALAEKYAAYKLSAIEAILGLQPVDTDVDSVRALAAAQNLVV